MEKGIQRRETQEIPWWTNPGGLRQDTYSKPVKLTSGLQSPVLLKLEGRRTCLAYAYTRLVYPKKFVPDEEAKTT